MELTLFLSAKNIILHNVRFENVFAGNFDACYKKELPVSSQSGSAL
jgi:hypothetical protein